MHTKLNNKKNAAFTWFLHYIVFVLLFFQDKTFGLKNKKGSKQQKFIQQVEKQVKSGGPPSARKLEELKKAELEKKKTKDDKDFSLLFKPVASQKIEKGEMTKMPCNIFVQYIRIL